MSTSTTVTVDALNAGTAQKIVDEALKLAQQACANYVLDHLLQHANDPTGTMPDLDVKQILAGAVTDSYATKLTGTLSTKGAGGTYFDGRRKKPSRKAAKVTLQCNVVKGSRRLGQRK